MCEALVILGPTASGKSALSLKIAAAAQAEIISLDSALIYKGMDIGTAKPTIQERSVCPHHLIDICDPSECYSAASFRSDCINLTEQIYKRGHMPIICGGTMMYYKALVDGLSNLPETDPAIRDKVQALANEKGWPALHAMLKDIDPFLFNKLAPNDKQRVSRALEVYFVSGKPMSSFFNQDKDCCPFKRVEIVLLPKDNDRTKLREIIRKRFMQMLDEGFLDEVKKLKERNDLNENMPSCRAVGYRQALMYLKGQVSYDEMIELAVIATARLAKHQMTWLRGGLKVLEQDDNNGQEPKATRYYLEIGDSENEHKALEIIKKSGLQKFLLAK